MIDETLNKIMHLAAEFYGPLNWFFLCGVCLTLLDLRFGLLAAKQRGEKIRFSRAIRRTGDKILNFFLWITMSELLRRTFGLQMGNLFGTDGDLPIISLCVQLIIYGIEMNSCINNYFEYRGINKRFNIWKLLNNKRLNDAVEDKEPTDNNQA